MKEKTIRVNRDNSYFNTLNALADEGKLSPVRFTFRGQAYVCNCMINALTWLKDQGYYDGNDPVVVFS